MMRKMLYLCGLPPKNTYPSSKHEKNIRLIMLQDILQHTEPCHQGHLKKDSLSNCHIREEPKETELNIMWYLGWDLGTDDIR